MGRAGKRTVTEELRSPAEKTRAAVAALWEKFSETLFGRLALLERAIGALREGSLSEDLRQEAEMGAHKLAGSLGTFGLPEGSKLAAEMELIFHAGIPRDQAQSERLAELVGSLRKEMERGPSRPA